MVCANFSVYYLGAIPKLISVSKRVVLCCGENVSYMFIYLRVPGNVSLWLLVYVIASMHIFVPLNKQKQVWVCLNVSKTICTIYYIYEKIYF